MVEITLREALRDAMAEEMRADKNVFLIGEEVAEYNGAYKVSQGLLQEFGPERVIDTTITEHGFTGIAIGAALVGLRPIVEFMTFNFAMQAIDQIINSAAKTKYMSGGLITCPIVFRGPNGMAARVGAQHSQCYASWYAHIPGLHVIAPYSATDAKALLKKAIKSDTPTIFLEHELLYGNSFDLQEEDVEIGKARIVTPGKDVTIVTFSRPVAFAMQALVELQKQGISAELIDLRSIRPWDKEAVIRSVKKTNRLVTVEEGWGVASVGNAIAATVMQEAFDYLDAPVLNVAAKEVPLPYAETLEKAAVPQVKDIIDACKAIL